MVEKRPPKVQRCKDRGPQAGTACGWTSQYMAFWAESGVVFYQRACQARGERTHPHGLLAAASCG
jgi:hypothetical protein